MTRVVAIDFNAASSVLQKQCHFKIAFYEFRKLLKQMTYNWQGLV